MLATMALALWKSFMTCRKRVPGYALARYWTGSTWPYLAPLE